MSPEHDRLSELFTHTHELESFFHKFIEHVAKQRPKAGEDVTSYTEKLGIAVPEALKGAKITWAGAEEHEAAQTAEREQTLVFARPGQADALGFTIGCVRVGRFKVCLECGWLYCRIVIKGRF